MPTLILGSTGGRDRLDLLPWLPIMDRYASPRYRAKHFVVPQKEISSCVQRKKEKLKGRYQCGRFPWIKSVPARLAVPCSTLGLRGSLQMCASDTAGDAFLAQENCSGNLKTWGLTASREGGSCQRAAGKGRAFPALGPRGDVNLETPSATSSEARKDRKHPPYTAHGVCASTV